MFVNENVNGYQHMIFMFDEHTNAQVWVELKKWLPTSLCQEKWTDFSSLHCLGNLVSVNDKE